MEALHSDLIAQGLGLYFIIMAIIMLGRANYYQNMIVNMRSNNGTVYLIGALGLALGISLVLVHSVFLWEPALLVTIISWLILIKSIVWLSVPEFMIRTASRFYESRPRYYMAGISLFVLGVILMAISTRYGHIINTR